MTPQVSIIMGSDSDLPIVLKTTSIFKKFNISYDVQILSAHRVPQLLLEYIKKAENSGTLVFIGVAGKAAHLPGVIASHTTLPVIGLPIKTSDLGGIDSLLSIVQMPAGVPVATVGINAGENAALLAAQILSINSKPIQQSLAAYRLEAQRIIAEKNEHINDTEGL